MKSWNYVDVLPWHPTLRWKKRNISDINTIIIHQAASSYKADSTNDIIAINNYHITPGVDNHISINGCPHICYHIVIDDNGIIYLTNNYQDITWHCKSKNSKAIGILIMGDFNAHNYIGKNIKPTKKQLDSLKEVMEGLFITPFSNLNRTCVKGHTECQLHKPNCPGDILIEWVKDFRNNTLKDSSLYLV